MSLDDQRYKNVSTSFGDPNPLSPLDGKENSSNFGADSSGFPSNGFIDNKTDVTTSWGDPPDEPDALNDNAVDFAQDSSGFSQQGLNNKTDMALSFEPNKFPRQTGHDSLTSEEDLLT